MKYKLMNVLLIQPQKPYTEIKPFSFDNPNSKHFKEIKEMEEKKENRRRREEEKQKKEEEELKKKEEKEMKAMIKNEPDIIPIATRALKKKVEKQFVFFFYHNSIILCFQNRNKKKCK